MISSTMLSAKETTQYLHGPQIFFFNAFTSHLIFMLTVFLLSWIGINLIKLKMKVQGDKNDFA